MIVGAVVLLVVVIALLAKSFAGSPATNPDKPKFPDFMDPATGKPKAGTVGSGQTPVSGRPNMPMRPSGG